MSHSFAQKLGLTAALLGCNTRKELGARFRTVNPATEFDLERSFKWMQGRSLPRSPTIYDDWALLIGTRRSGNWLSACSPEAFVEELVELYSADREDLTTRASRFLGNGGQKYRPEDSVVGEFVCYSWAWSPFHRGSLIRGTLGMTHGPRNSIDGVYRETLPGGILEVRGRMQRTSRFVHGHLEAPDLDHIGFSLLIPGRPVTVLCGQILGSIVAGPDAAVAASRAVMIRRGAAPSPLPISYIAAETSVLCRDFAAAGIVSAAPEDLAGAILAYLRGTGQDGADRVSSTEITAIARFAEAV